MFPRAHLLPSHYAALFNAFQERYLKAVVLAPEDLGPAMAQLECFLDLVISQVENPYAFEVMHHALRTPFDYYAFGLKFIRPLLDLDHSRLLGLEHLKMLEKAREKGDNVIFFANHQIEADPQVLSILLQTEAPKLAEEFFSVAGARVTSDPLAVPFSLGRNLLSVYSKNHMSTDPEKRATQQTHNLRTINALSEMLQQGGYAIYVAPSGGRDRPDAEGLVLPSPFDPTSIQLFTLLAKKARRPVYFTPMALSTYAVLPPPDTRQAQLGEERYVAKNRVGVAIGEPLNFEPFSLLEKEVRQQAAADYAGQAVMVLYETLQHHLSLE